MPEEFKILIADSDEYARKSMRRWVKRIANSKILEACSGFEAILTARDEMPDLILLDVLLDETDEYQAFKGAGAVNFPRNKAFPRFKIVQAYDSL